MSSKIEDLENQLKITNDKLKSTENRLESVIKLVYKTFNGDGAAAYELSNIVGTPPPILYCDDEKPPNKSQANESNKSSYKESNDRFNNRLEFLNQVMSDHDKMMISNYGKPISNKRLNSAGHHNRVRSADRMSRKADRAYFNPYTWNLNEHMHPNQDSIYKYTNAIPVASGMSKPLISKSIKSRPETRQNNLSDVKVEDFLNHSANRRSIKSHSPVKPNPLNHDFKLMSDNEINLRKPPKATRSTSSLSYTRSNSAKTNLKSKVDSPYHNLNLQSMTESDNKAEELLKAMEKRFELSTIDLQRRLGISQAGMVGP